MNPYEQFDPEHPYPLPPKRETALSETNPAPAAKDMTRPGNVTHET